MTNVPYNTNIPFASNSPSQDQPRMQENTNSLKSLIEIDHVGFGQTFGGYHNVIHQGPQVADPASIAGIGQTYTKTVSGDQQLFFESGAGIISQLTSAITPVSSVVGTSYLPGGIIINWGRQVGTGGGSFASGSANGSATYATAFPTAVFVVLCVPFYNSGLSTPGSSGSVNPDIATFSTLSSFNWKFNSSSGDYRGFSYIAIGN